MSPDTFDLKRDVTPEYASTKLTWKAVHRWACRLLVLISLVICGLAGFSLISWSDPLATVTVFPAWVFFVVGMLLLALGSRGVTKKTAAVVTMVWLAYAIAFIEEPRSLIRGVWRTSGVEESDSTIRVVSLNCASVGLSPLNQLTGFDPDIVLLQESPNRKQLEQFAADHFGEAASVVWGVDTSLIVRGQVLPKQLPRDQSGYMTHARVVLASGDQIEVVNIRLNPPLVSLDFWSPQVWKQQTAKRRVRVQQVQEVAECIKGVPLELPLIAGGDLNTPAKDAMLRVWKPRLRDAFHDGGIGLCNTITNDFPFHRIDQIWVSDHFSVVSLRAVKTVHSDHRMVVCDLLLGRASK